MYFFLTSRRANCGGQFAVGHVVLCDDDKPAGFLVEAVNDSRAHLAADLRERREVVQQRIDQGAAIARVVGGAGAGVDHHAGGLVDDGEVVVFVEDIEGDFFRRWHAKEAAPAAPENCDVLAAPQFQRGFGGGIVHEDFLFGNQLLDTSAADVEVGGEELIEAFASFFCENRNRGAGALPASGCDDTTA